MLLNFIKLQIENTLLYTAELSSDEFMHGYLYSDDSLGKMTSLFALVEDFVDQFGKVIDKLFLNEDVSISVSLLNKLCDDF
jgi:hypothetical protein